MGNDNESTKKNEVSFIKSFIPQKISNKTALNFFDFLRAISKINKNKFEQNLSKNLVSFENHKKTIEKNNGYIEDQHNYHDMYYGNKTFDFCGCEIISLYNALNDLKVEKEISLPLLIDYFEKDGIVLSGIFGTAPTAIEDYLKNEGFETSSTMNEEDFEKICENSDSIIFTFYVNKNNIFDQVHCVNISKKDRKYFVHNNGHNSHLKLYNSIKEFINKGNKGLYKGIFLIGIKKKNIQ